MKPAIIAAIIVVCVVVAGAGGYLLLKRGAGLGISAPAGFTQTGQTTLDNNTITTYSGAGTTQEAYGAFKAWMEGQGWQYKMENSSFGGYTGNLYEKENETAVVQATSQAGQVTVVVVSGPKPSGPSETGLVAHYAFDEGTGTTASDSSGNNSSGAVINATWTTGRIGNALYFDGDGDYVRIPGVGQAAPSQIANLSQGTIAFWFKFEGQAGGSGIFLPIFYVGPSPEVTDTNRGVIIEIGHKGIWNDSQELFYTVTTSASAQPTLCFDSGSDLTSGQWYHFAVTVSSTKNTGYLDGQEMTSREYNFGNSTMSYFLNAVDGGILSIGYGRSAIDRQFYYFKGTIDDVRIYNGALSASEIQQLYQPSGGPQTTYYDIIKNGRFGGGGGESTDFAAMQDLGAHWRRIPWIVTRQVATSSTIDFNQWDSQVAQGQQYGVMMYAQINPNADQNGVWPTAQEFADFLKKVVERYDGDGIDDMPGLVYPIKAYEICNEIDLHPASPFWAGFTDENYLEYMQKSHQALKEACPDAQLAAGSLVGGTRLGVLELLNIQTFDILIDSGGADYFEIISYFSYVEYLLIDNLTAHLAQKGIDKPIWITGSQFGGNEAPEGTQEEVAQKQTRSYVYALAKGVSKITPSELSEMPYWPEDLGLAWSAMIDRNGNKRPSYYAYRTMAAKLDNFTSVQELAQYKYKFTVNNKPVYVLWGSGSVPSEITGTVTKTDISGSAQQVQASQITLSDSPVFVEPLG